MLRLFRAVLDRIKLLFAVDAALELESEFLARAAGRKADLLRRAAAYEAEGLRPVAADLRRQAEAIDCQQPLAGALAALQHLDPEGRAAPPAAADDAEGDGAAPQLPDPGEESAGTRRKARCDARGQGNKRPPR